MDGWKAAEDKKLEDIGAELRSLKLLVANRLGAGAGPQAFPSNRSYPAPGAKEKPDNNNNSGISDSTLAANSSEDLQGGRTPSIAPSGSAFGTPESGTTIPKPASTGRYQGSGRVAIPAWQMPATGGKAGVGSTGKTEEGAGTDIET